MPSATALVDLENLRFDVDQALQRHLDRLGREVDEVGKQASAMIDQIAALVQGGKRLRAAFCYWSYRAHGGSAGEGPARTAVVRAGAALELFQAAALLHDDVMDASDTRRGLPTAHRAFETMHTQSGWSGESARFGTSAAILLGDLCLVGCQRELREALEPLPSPTASAASALFDAMQSEVIVGQYLDVLVQAEPWGVDPVVDEERARTVIRAKSARYSVEHPLALGAVLAGATDQQVETVRAVGLPLGEAFQLRDDVLGVFGDPDVTGKPAGDDLREGKRTVLMARTMAGADAGQRALVSARLGDPALDATAVTDLRAAIVESGALAAVEATIDELTADALASLERTALAEPGRTILADLARAAVDRTA